MTFNTPRTGSYYPSKAEIDRKAAYTQHITQQIRKGAEAWNHWREEGQDFSSAPDLSEIDLSGTNLAGANLSKANLTRANLTGTNLSDANLTGADLTSANLTGTNLSASNLTGANLNKAKLRDVKIDSETRLSDKWKIVFEILNDPNFNRNLNRADLSNVNLETVNLSGANLSHAKLSGAVVDGVDFVNADLRSANLSNASLKNVDLSDADLSNANLENSWLPGAKLCRTNFSNADLSKANLSSADLNGANFSKANLSKANLSSTDLSGANFSKANLSSANLSSADLSGADFSKANLTNSSLMYINAKSTNFRGCTFTGSNIFDWKIDSETELGSVICSYYRFHYERRPRIPFSPLKDGELRDFIVKEFMSMNERPKENQTASNTFINAPNSNIGGINTGKGMISKVIQNNNFNVEQQKTLAEAAKEIQDLLDQLAGTYPTDTLSQKAIVAAKAVEAIEQDPSFMERIKGALKACGLEALREAVDNPLFNIVSASLDGFVDP